MMTLQTKHQSMKEDNNDMVNSLTSPLVVCPWTEKLHSCKELIKSLYINIPPYWRSITFCRQSARSKCMTLLILSGQCSVPFNSLMLILHVFTVDYDSCSK